MLNTFPKEKVIVNRERSANAYDTLSYFCAKYLVELPLNCFPTVVYACIVYWMVGLNPNAFGVFILILMLEAMTAISLGLAISALTPSLEAALGIGPPTIIVALIFGGFYINISSLPIVANWIPYVSFLKWTFEALCVNEFQGEKFNCAQASQGACKTTGEQVLESLSFGGRSTSEAVFGLAMLLIGFTLAALGFLHNSRMTYIPLGHVGRNQKLTPLAEVEIL